MTIRPASPPPRALRLTLPALALSAALLTACSGKEQAAGGPPPGGMPALPVTVLTMQPTTVETSVEAVAQTEGAREVEIRARVGGILTKRLYEEGAPVKAGQPLFQLDREHGFIKSMESRFRLSRLASRNFPNLFKRGL